MSYKINYIEDKGIVEVNIQGRINYSTAQGYSLAAIKLARENNCRNYLFDHTETLLESGVYKIHMDGDTLERFGFSSSDKIAIIILSDKKDNHLFEKPDNNVKWSNFKYFNSHDEAVEWLETEE